MTQNDKLPEEIQEQINDQAEVYANKYLNGKANTHEFGILEEGYIAGATTWAQWKVKHDELQKENDRLNESCNKLFKQSCQFNNDLVDVRAQAQRMAYALEAWFKAKNKLIEATNAGHGHYVAEAQELVYKYEDALKEIAQQFKDGKGKDRPCPHCGKELSRDRNLCCRECGKEVGDGIH